MCQSLRASDLNITVYSSRYVPSVLKTKLAYCFSETGVVQRCMIVYDWPVVCTVCRWHQVGLEWPVRTCHILMRFKSRWLKVPSLVKAESCLDTRFSSVVLRLCLSVCLCDCVILCIVDTCSWWWHESVGGPWHLSVTHCAYSHPALTLTSSTDVTHWTACYVRDEQS